MDDEDDDIMAAEEGEWYSRVIVVHTMPYETLSLPQIDASTGDEDEKFKKEHVERKGRLPRH